MNSASAIANIIDELYLPVDGMKISLAERDRLQISDSNFTYGEIKPDTFIEMLKIAQPKPGEVFYDLGSGAGKAIFCAALCNDWSKCCGVEVLPALANTCKEVLRSFEKMQKVKDLYPDRKFNINIIQEDFLKADFSDADVIFLHATTFGQPIWDNLKQKLNQLKPGTRAIVNTKQLDAEYFEKIDEQTRTMGWGESNVYTYRKYK